MSRPSQDEDVDPELRQELDRRAEDVLGGADFLTEDEHEARRED